MSELNSDMSQSARLSVAPMMDWTDRHCRVFHRMLSQQTLLYTEMVTAPAVIHGDRDRLLGFDAVEHPVAVQLGGSDPKQLAEATAISADYGYDEVNLNCGCPSDRVQSGAFGAILMKSPDLVAECVAEMIAASPVEVTVKCRIGVDDQEPHDVLPEFIAKVSAAGVKRFTIHARKAWLQGLSPKENRDIPPLDYDLVHQIKRDNPDLHISINGGIATLDAAEEQLAQGLDGVMIGRAAYHNPADVLCQADRRIYGQGTDTDPVQIVRDMLPYIETHLSNGGRLHQVTRHMLGAFMGRPGARGWRRHLSENATRDGAGIETVEAALEYLL
ncbi:tRNA dihydrouridine(20/20a) synthase DusA [Marivivens niveibacter]|uniref:tRNA-dihydrouridine(20/20a) synthase n=1 Tax=Marivivens niveibacter TaxID=1930667 RepID=A0A251X2I3_9RHOB|nr:tRNA dihydrouridine(20/20a) synthase DusA [Marivivens niveibacter]OUD10625.1 tRNA dihydrouridine(20/20a) synthase DusA [Marivivens niveibacter]